MEEYVRQDVYQANREAAELERKQLADRIATEAILLATDLSHVKEDIKEINERLRWLLRTVVSVLIMLLGNFLFLMLTRGM